MKHDFRKDELINLEDAAKKIINEYGSEDQKNHFKKELEAKNKFKDFKIIFF